MRYKKRDSGCDECGEQRAIHLHAHEKQKQSEIKWVGKVLNLLFNTL